MRKALSLGLVVALVLSLAPSASAGIVFENILDNGFFTPFSSASSSDERYGDGGWLSGFQPETYTLTQIDLLMTVFDGASEGVTDIEFTFNDGDPSGLVFGTGAELYSTTIEDVVLPATDEGSPGFFTLSIPLPNVVTAGGFNNIGWSVGVSNFQYDGQLGFGVSSGFGQSVGFYTSNASYYDGSSWSLFSFGPDPIFGVANFVATVYEVPEPTSLVLLGVGTMMALRRRVR